jgi:predicted metal-dependent phosphoesterase TrpH
VAQLAEAGIRLFAVTDHDTVAALPAVAEAARRHGLAWLPGIEITAVEAHRDVHVLGYGFDVQSSALAQFLRAQRDARLERIHQFARRFDDLGVPVDLTPLVTQAQTSDGRAVGRAHVARSLVAAGHARTVDEAFDRWLAPGRPGFVPRHGAPVADVVMRIVDAGGLASLAHPALLRDDRIVEQALGGSRLQAVEAYHSEHDAIVTRHYAEWSGRLGLAVSGGSDFHGVAANRMRRLGAVTLPIGAYDALRARAAGGAFAWPDATDARRP